MSQDTGQRVLFVFEWNINLKAVLLRNGNQYHYTSIVYPLILKEACDQS